MRLPHLPPPIYRDLPRRGPCRSHRLAVQDVALSRRKQGFESPWERQRFQYLTAHSTNDCGHVRKSRGKGVARKGFSFRLSEPACQWRNTRSQMEAPGPCRNIPQRQRARARRGDGKAFSGSWPSPFCNSLARRRGDYATILAKIKRDRARSGPSVGLHLTNDFIPVRLATTAFRPCQSPCYGRSLLRASHGEVRYGSFAADRGRTHHAICRI